MMHKIKKWLAFGGVGTLGLLLAACAQTTGRKVSTTHLKPPSGFFGMFYRVIGKPLQSLMMLIADHLPTASAYGLSIIIITIVVRLILLPAMVNQQRKMTISQEKMKVLKPQVDIVQAQMKKTTDQQETARLSMLMQKIYKENGTSMMPSMGCLTLLIQLPIFSGLYQAVAYSPEISKSTFFGVELGHSSIVITIIATLFYLAQSWVMMQGVPADQRKAMQFSGLLSPIMTFFFCLMYNAGLGLYFLAGGIMILIQQVIVTYIVTPNVRKKLDQEMSEHPPVVLVDENTFKDDTPAPAENVVEADSDASTEDASDPDTPHKTGHGRNAGKQQHHHHDE